MFNEDMKSKAKMKVLEELISKMESKELDGLKNLKKPIALESEELASEDLSEKLMGEEEDPMSAAMGKSEEDEEMEQLMEMYAKLK